MGKQDGGKNRPEEIHKATPRNRAKPGQTKQGLNFCRPSCFLLSNFFPYYFLLPYAWYFMSVRVILNHFVLDSLSILRKSMVEISWTAQLLLAQRCSMLWHTGYRFYNLEYARIGDLANFLEYIHLHEIDYREKPLLHTAKPALVLPTFPAIVFMQSLQDRYL